MLVYIYHLIEFARHYLIDYNQHNTIDLKLRYSIEFARHYLLTPVEKSDDYMKALESASVDQNIQPFASFLGHLVKETMRGKAVAELPD